MKDERLIRLSLQFFGGDPDEDFDEYEDDEDLDDEDLDDEYLDEEEAESKEEETSDGGDDENAGAEDAENDENADESADDTAALIAELKAAGYVGDDIKSLTADIKKKHEDASGKAAAAERAAANKEGKGHVKSGKPSKSASGDGMAGFTHRDVEEMKRAIGPHCTEERARRALEKRIRANAR